MRRLLGSRSIAAICLVMIVLLAALVAVQYRWSRRVAAADALREREHLESAVSLFANEFAGRIGRAVVVLQDETWSSFQSHRPAATVPEVIAELYYLEPSAAGKPRLHRLGADRLFGPAAIPLWLQDTGCAPRVIDSPPGVVVPLYEMSVARTAGAGGTGVSMTFRQDVAGCFVARLDEAYLHDTLFPELIRRSFGETAIREYDFAVVSRSQPRAVLYGASRGAELRKPFFSAESVIPSRTRSSPPLVPGRTEITVQHTESTVGTGAPGVVTEPLASGLWELEVAHKGGPFNAVFERTRRRELWLILGVEALLVAAVVLLVTAAVRISRFANQKVRFVAAVSHELRTPVSAITMLSRNQADGLVTSVEQVKQYGELIHQQSRRLNDMIERALQYSGVHSGLPRPMKGEVDLRHLIEQVVSAHLEELTRSGFQVVVELDASLPALVGDGNLLRIAVDNLLANAEKHAKAGRWVRVKALYSSSDKEVQVSVEDRGPGMAAEDREAVFEPFHRGPAATEGHVPGSGLGLSLVRSAAEVHGGTVTLSSEPGKGCTFCIHLPV